MEKIAIEHKIARTGTELAQCCVFGHICHLGVMVTNAKPVDPLTHRCVNNPYKRGYTYRRLGA